MHQTSDQEVKPEMNEQISKDDLVKSCANPKGEAGLQTIERMNVSHEPLTEWGLSHITIGLDDQILDVGCGGGMALSKVNGLNPKGKCFGVDISALSLAEAGKLNRKAVEEGHMVLRESGVSTLPFADRCMDVVISIESFYFWPDPACDLKEIVRVLKEGGSLMIALEYNADMEKDDDYRHNQELLHMTIPSATELADEFAAAGLCDVLTDLRGPWLCAVGRKK